MISTWIACVCVCVRVAVVTNGIGYYATLFRGTVSTRYAHKIFIPTISIILLLGVWTHWHLRINFARFFMSLLFCERLDFVSFICSIHCHILFRVGLCSSCKWKILFGWNRELFPKCFCYDSFSSPFKRKDLRNEFNRNKYVLIRNEFVYQALCTNCRSLLAK